MQKDEKTASVIIYCEMKGVTKGEAEIRSGTVYNSRKQREITAASLSDQLIRHRPLLNRTHCKLPFRPARRNCLKSDDSVTAKTHPMASLKTRSVKAKRRPGLCPMYSTAPLTPASASCWLIHYANIVIVL